MQRLKLDINPTGEIPVLYVAQYDKGRSFEVELVDGEQAYNVPSGYSVQLNVRKTDSKLVTAAPTNVAENILTFATSEQMTACAGENIGSVTLKDADDIVITTLYFLISVQRDVLAGGLDSASEIHNLEQQIAAIVPEVIGDDYYNKSETDALLANKANISDLDNLASKAELEHAIDEEDRTLKDWAFTQFATPGYIANRYYNKTQVDELLFNMLPIGTALDNPCSFNTEISAVLHALTAEIVASGGGGTPSNPIPIVGHSELNLTRCGKNLFSYNDLPLYSGYFDVVQFNGTPLDEVDVETVESWRWCYYLIPVSDKTAITLSGFDSEGGTQAVWLFDLNDFTNFQNAFGSHEKNGTHTIPNNAKYLVVPMNDLLSKRTNFPDAQAEYGSTATAYAPYNGNTFTVAFGQTVYGGVYDKSGRLTIEPINKVTLTGTENWSVFQSGSTSTAFYISGFKNDVANTDDQYCSHFVYNQYAYQADAHENTFIQDTSGNLIIQISNSIAATVEDFKSWLATQYANNTPVEYRYNSTATPIVIDVPSISVSAVVGTNNIISDCNGDVNVSYKDSIQHYIDSRI